MKGAECEREREGEEKMEGWEGRGGILIVL